MFELVGYQTEYTPNSYTGQAVYFEREEIVATFDSEKDAYDYIKKSKLKNPKKPCWNDGYKFLKKSLLGPYADAEVREKVSPEPIPHNPKI